MHNTVNSLVSPFVTFYVTEFHLAKNLFTERVSDSMNS